MLHFAFGFEPKVQIGLKKLESCMKKELAKTDYLCVDDMRGNLYFYNQMFYVYCV